MKILRTSLISTVSFLLILGIFAGCTPTPATPTTPTESAIPAQTQTTIPQPETTAPQPTTSDITYSTPKEISVWTPKMKQTFLDLYNAELQTTYTFEEMEKAYGKYSFFDVGTITNEKYKDEKLLLFVAPSDGPHFSDDIYRFAYNETKKALTLLKKHSTDGGYIINEIKSISTKTDSTTNLAGLDAPDKILIPGTDKYMELDMKDESDTFVNPTINYLETYKTKYEDKNLGITIYYHSKSPDEYTVDGCFRALLQDGTVSMYSYKPNFTKDITDKYSLTSGACGTSGSCYLIENLSENDLIKSEKTSGDINFYTPKDPKTNKTILDNYERFKAQKELDKGADPKVKVPSLEELIAMEPILYWQDPIGRWSSIINNDVKPMAECGKPVIYLYPEKTTDVSVQVGVEKLTKTIPEYKNGWRVEAEPNGTLYNYADQKSYPYLFWEGQNKGLITPTKGSSVKRADIEKFLNDSLDSLGLTGTEKKDFTDFWLSKMLANKQDYFFVSFIGTRDFNKVAPLKISPTPDTLIRIFMYYMPLNKPMRSEKQDLTSIDRNGFTVVEWGGTSSVPWQE